MARYIEGILCREGLPVGIIAASSGCSSALICRGLAFARTLLADEVPSFAPPRAALRRITLIRRVATPDEALRFLAFSRLGFAAFFRPRTFYSSRVATCTWYGASPPLCPMSCEPGRPFMLATIPLGYLLSEPFVMGPPGAPPYATSAWAIVASDPPRPVPNSAPETTASSPTPAA
jgi:hypothetical protein